MCLKTEGSTSDAGKMYNSLAPNLKIQLFPHLCGILAEKQRKLHRATPDRKWSGELLRDYCHQASGIILL